MGGGGQGGMGGRPAEHSPLHLTLSWALCAGAHQQTHVSASTTPIRFGFNPFSKLMYCVQYDSTASWHRKGHDVIFELFVMTLIREGKWPIPFWLRARGQDEQSVYS